MSADKASAKRSRDEASITEESAAKRPRYNYDDMIVLLVGRTEQRFTVHKEIICAKSKFFKAACTERWLEGQQKTVRLPEIEPTRFQHYVDWIYTNELAMNDITQSYYPCVKLYLLGSYLDDVQFRNKSIASRRGRRQARENASELDVEKADLGEHRAEITSAKVARRQFCSKE